MENTQDGHQSLYLAKEQYVLRKKDTELDNLTYKQAEISSKDYCCKLLRE